MAGRILLGLEALLRWGHPTQGMLTPHAFLDVAKTLGMHTLAEGVENRFQTRFLAEASCDAIQGYYFSRPVAAHRIPELLHEQKLVPQLIAGLSE